MQLDELLKILVAQKGSDLHLSVGLKPLIRRYGRLLSLDYPVIQKDEMETLVASILPESKRSRLKKEGQVDFAYEVPNLGRFRGNAFLQVRGLSIAFRVIPKEVMPISEIGLSNQILEQCGKRSGLILVTGPTGSGKSTTLASIIDYINERKEAHIITIEDPIEFVHKSKKCLIHQRQVGEHTQSFAGALRSALREDPDIILVGEMRDLETIEMALTAAETGHLVFGTLHTRNAAKTLDRIISVFPGSQQNQIRAMAAESIRAIISQILLPRVDRPGMIAAFELLIMTPGIQNLIRDMKIYQIPSAIQTGAKVGMCSMSQSLKKLMLERIIDPNVAQEFISMKSIQSQYTDTSEQGPPGGIGGKPGYRMGSKPAKGWRTTYGGLGGRSK